MSTEHQSGHGKRELVKGKLQPPSKPPSTKSYTVTSASINEVIVRKPSERKVNQDPVEISSAATAQPFLDPTILERRRRNSGMT
ncbi:hypothetical protein Daesc_009511 [Daldinia eschscholtzii]|uniref:Uncharacterized protein n=1 Tax=Daldinia eschscholtzii TaxID=292717 RepID=A0AAX6MB58_9PEZI